MMYHRKVYVREEVVTTYIERKLIAIKIPNEQLSALIEYLKQSLQSDRHNDQQQIIDLQHERNEI